MHKHFRNGLGLLLAVSFCCFPAVAAGQKLGRRIDAAIDRGVAALVPVFPKILKDTGTEFPMGSIALCLTAVLESGLPSDHEVVRRTLEKLESMPVKKTYSVACYLFALDAYWQARYREWKERAEKKRTVVAVPRVPPDGLVRKKMEELVDWLVKGKGGGWGYEGRGGGDLSNAQFAVLGLEIGLQNKISVPAEVFRAVADRLVSALSRTGERRQFVIVYRTRAWEGVTAGRLRPKRYRVEAGGWNYTYASKGTASSNMTAAGLSSLLIARGALKELDAYPEELAAKVDPCIESALGWMAMDIDRYFGFDLYGLYGMYTLEKVGDIAGIAQFGKVDWYARGAAWLLKKQARDGTWDGGRGGTLVGTPLALLFLTRATQSPVQILGPPVFARGEKGYQGDSGLVYLPQQNGFVSAKVFFEFLAETRDPKVLLLAADAVKSYPPHLVHELLSYLLELWTKKKDPVTHFAAKQAAILSGVRKIQRKDCAALADQLREVRAMDVAGAAEGDRLSELLEETRSPVLKRRLLALIDRLGQVDTFDAVAATLEDRDAKIAERCEEILSAWARQYQDVTGGDIPRVEKNGGKGGKRSWSDWWSRHKNDILSSWRSKRTAQKTADPSPR